MISEKNADLNIPLILSQQLSHYFVDGVPAAVVTLSGQRYIRDDDTSWREEGMSDASFVAAETIALIAALVTLLAAILDFVRRQRK